MNQMARRAGFPEYRFFATALSLQNQTGGALSENARKPGGRYPETCGAQGQRPRNDIRSKSNSRHPRVAGRHGTHIWALSPDYIALLFNDPLGRNLFATAVVSLITGLLVIRTIIKKSLPA